MARKHPERHETRAFLSGFALKIDENRLKIDEHLPPEDGMWDNFELGGTTAFLGTVYPSALMACQHFERPAFPAWLQTLGPTDF